MAAAAGSIVLLLLLSPGANGQPPMVIPSSVLQDPGFCLGCHGEESQAPAARGTDCEALRSSVHQALTCVDCHTDIATIPHQAAAAVDCRRCHNGRDGRAPARRGSASETKTGSAPALRLGPSRHQAASSGEQRRGPTCVKCHGAHDVVRPGSAASPVGPDRIADTCGACHVRIARDYQESVHGQALLAGNRDVPTCQTCHPEHPESGRRGVLEGGVVATCVSCHEDPALQRRYGIEGKRLASYLGSYHGAATALGDSRTANCATCHGTHDIRPSGDPRSSVNPANLPRTCGRCHPGVNENVTKGKVHVLASPESAALLYYINLGFRWFTFSIIFALVGHIGLNLLGRWRGRTGE